MIGSQLEGTDFGLWFSIWTRISYLFGVKVEFCCLDISYLWFEIRIFGFDRTFQRFRAIFLGVGNILFIRNRSFLCLITIFKLSFVIFCGLISLSMVLCSWIGLSSPDLLNFASNPNLMHLISSCYKPPPVQIFQISSQ